MAAEEEVTQAVVESLRQLSSILVAQGLITRNTKVAMLGNILAITLLAESLDSKDLEGLMMLVDGYAKERLLEKIKNKDSSFVPLGGFEDVKHINSMEDIIQMAVSKMNPDNINIADVLKGTGATPPKPE